jgi:hypothetical protein
MEMLLRLSVAFLHYPTNPRVSPQQSDSKSRMTRTDECINRRDNTKADKDTIKDVAMAESAQVFSGPTYLHYVRQVASTRSTPDSGGLR